MNLAQAFDSLASRRVVLFGGKGGVGKTTISSAAALHFAKTKRVVLFTTDPASNLSDLFTEVAGITIEEVDAKTLYKRFLDENLGNLLEIGDRGTYLDREELERFFQLSLPGVDELMSWMRIGELAEQNVDALIVVDTAPTGHTMRMLGAASHFRQFADALDAMQAKHRSMVQQFTRRNVRDAIDDYIARFDEDALRRRELLTNASTAAFVPVTLSEPWVVEQTKRLMSAIDIDVPFVILNRAVVDADCSRDRELQKRDANARAAFSSVVDAPRSCVPLDSVDALRGVGQAPSPVPPRGNMKVGEARAPVLHISGKLLFLAGKGGVGKTTCASSIALQLAQKHPDRRYTIISVDPAHALRDVFAHESPPKNLAVEIVDTASKWRNFRGTLGDEIERAINAMTPGNFTVAYDVEAIHKLIDIAPPGADELFAVSRLAELADDESQSMVIVDTAPTGHFLRLLELPETAGDWVREFMRILLHYREIVPAGQLGQELLNASRAMHSLEQTLVSNRAATIVVTRPERIVVDETRRLIDTLERKQMKIETIVANYLTPENDCKCDQSMRAHELAELARLGDFVPVVRADTPVTRLAALATLFRVESD